MTELLAMDERSENFPSDIRRSSPILPNDLLHRVLSLLPLQTLFRLRCVCKLWRSLPFSLLFADNMEARSSPPDLQNQQLHQFWFLAFRLLARKVNEHHMSTYKATMYTYSIAFDREFIASAGYTLALPLGSGSEHSIQKGYGILGPSSSLISCLKAGVIDIVASANGLLLLTLRLSKAVDDEDNNLKLFVYNPISQDVRTLPITHFAPQKLSMIFYRDSDDTSSYKIYSLGRSYRPGTKYLLYSFEVFDSAQAHCGWQSVSHVRANLTGSGDLHPGTETALMGHVNLKTICNEQGFLYWMPSLEHKSGAGRHAELLSCHMTTGFFYRLPVLPFKTTFANMWPCASGLMLVCGVVQGDDMSHTCGVEIWELCQGDEGPVEDEGFYGTKCVPQGTRWQPYDKMVHDLWDRLTCKSTRRVACAVALPLVCVVAENEEEHMVVYNTNDRTWRLTPCWPVLHMFFNDKGPQYFKVYPWIVAFMPSVSTVV